MSQLNLEIKYKLDQLSSALLSAHPQIPTLLRDIRNTLKAFPEQVTLMTEEEINLCVRGLEKQTNSYIAAVTVKPSAAKKAALKNVTSDDLGF
jgi:hypothetical protein